MKWRIFTHRMSFFFTEEEPAIIVPPARELKVAEGRDIELTCITSGKPDPIITWRKEGEQITGGRYQIMPNGNLHVEVKGHCSFGYK